MSVVGADTELSQADVRTYYRERVPDLKQTHTKEWRGGCPLHGGKDLNFAVNSETGEWFCHSRCGRGGDVFALEMALSASEFQAAKKTVLAIIGSPETMPQSRRRIRATYDYTDQDGRLLYQVVRFEPKGFAQRRPDGHGGSVWNLKGIKRVLYRLPQVLAADRVFIVEGEKDVETLESWELTATCNPGGSGNWLPAYARCLKAKHAIILPDNDQPGREHALTIAESLIRVAASVRVVELLGLPEKGDVSDWAKAGHTVEELSKLVAAAPVLTDGGLAELRARWAPSQAAKPPERRVPFRVNDDGVFFLKEMDDDAVEPVRLAARVDIIAKTRDERGENWGRLLRWRDDENRLHQWAMPMEVLASDGAAVRARLLAEGLPLITTNTRLRERFAEFLQTAPVERLVRCVSRVGWQNTTFVLPDEAIGPDGGEEVLFQSPHESVHYWHLAGTTDEWRNHVGRRCAGNSRLIISSACGFAGPLVRLIGTESGGINFHGATSTGKTTVLMVGGSVCGGGGQSGFVQTWRATLNGLEAIAEAHNDATLFLDELAQVDAWEAGETAYLLANGQGKSRMTRSVGARKKLAWNLLFVSAGELTLAEHAGSVGRRTRGGAEVRLLNIEADAGKGMGIFENIHNSASPDEFARSLKEAARLSYGAPFRAFLARLTRNAGEVEQTVRKAREAFVNRYVPAGAAGEVRRAADRFALIGAAGELATEWGFTAWGEGESIGAAARCLREWVEQRGTSGASDTKAAIRQVRAFLEGHGASRFQTLKGEGSEETQAIRDRAGFKRRDSETGETQYLILPEVFRGEVCAGYSYGSVLKALDQRGFLIRTPPAMTIKPRLPELGSVRVYCIPAAILEEPE